MDRGEIAKQGYTVAQAANGGWVQENEQGTRENIETLPAQHDSARRQADTSSKDRMQQVRLRSLSSRHRAE